VLALVKGGYTYLHIQDDAVVVVSSKRRLRLQLRRASMLGSVISPKVPAENHAAAH
jgi:hypothetical protein